MITVADGYTVEYATCVIVSITASLCLIGGLGATFYASYIQASFIMLIILLFAAKVFFIPGDLLGTYNILTFFKRLRFLIETFFRQVHLKKSIEL